MAAVDAVRTFSSTDLWGVFSQTTLQFKYSTYRITREVRFRPGSQEVS
jgi:hypothetical protein